MVSLLSPQIKEARVLVVEDDLIMRTMLARLLGPHVAEVHVAADGSEGLVQWRKHHPDVVISDISMPIMDGLAMSEAIKIQDPDSQIIIITGSSDIDNLRRAIDIGVERYVFKPVDSKLLLDAVSKCLRDRCHQLELKMAKMVFEVGTEGILVTDDEPRILACNPAFSEISGYRPDEIVGRKPTILASGIHGPDFYRSMWSALNAHGRWSGEIVNRRKTGEIYSEWLSIAAVKGKSGAAKRYVGIVSDITERKQQEERIRRLAHFDSLTGLPNRVLFNDRLQRSIVDVRRHGGRLALLYLDLDYFKAVNDTYGHAVGDQVLSVMAKRMQDLVRQSDTVSRRGGDEFVLLLDAGKEGESTAVVCDKLITSISRPVLIGGHAVTVGASIGVALFPDDADDADALLAAADSALYEAKAAGRGCFNYFRPDTQLKAWDRLNMEQELRNGLKDWRFSLRYLPEISVITGELENIEVLLRFQHPTRGLIEAGRFLEVAEEIGIMPELGQRALAEAAYELTAIRGAAHRHLGLVVDLSARQLSAHGAVDGLLAILKQAGIHAGDVTFECPERALYGNDEAMRTLASLAAAGCKFTLDDFGAGYCSFNLLSQLAMNSIKIDRSFVGEVDKNPQSSELVAALIAFSKRLGLRTVAEGVENAEQLNFLRENHCDSVQGFIFGQPMDKASLMDFLARQAWRPIIGEAVPTLA